MVKVSSVVDDPEEGSALDPANAGALAETPLDGMMAEERRTQILQIVRSAGGSG
jgi:hypothetical protein